MLSASAHIIQAGAQRFARLSRHEEVHPGHFLRSFLKRPHIEAEIRKLANRRGLAQHVENSLRACPEHTGPIRDELPPLSPAVESFIRRAKERGARRDHAQSAVTEVDLLIALIQSKDFLVDEALKKFEVDQDRLLWEFDHSITVGTR